MAAIGVTQPGAPGDDAESAPDGEIIASVDHLAFSYGRRQALHDISFHVLKGEAVALLGHNGAGKTTTIRLMNGLLRADAGTMQVLGFDPANDGAALRRHTSVVTDTLGLHDRDTAARTFEYHSQLWDLDGPETVRKGMVLLERFGLADRANEKIKSFSRGMRQRLAIVRALLNDPQLILMDEPTLGMDPVARQDFRDLLNDLRETGVSVVISTHDLGEVERVCNRLVILQHGRTIIEGTPQECMRPFMKDVEVEIECDHSVGQLAREQLQGLHSLSRLRVDGVVTRFRAADVDAISDAVARLVQAGERVVRVGSNAPTLEDVYLRIHNVVPK